MNYLITGSTGYIGSQLVNRLQKSDSKIIGLYHHTKPEIVNKNIEYIRGDISDKTLITRLPRNIDVVIHCAALVKDYGSRKDFYKINIEGTKNIIDYSKKIQASQFMYLGHINYESRHRFNYYSETKTIAEKFLMEEIKKNQIPITIIRPGNVFGPAAPVYVVRVIQSMRKNKFSLIENGKGIFHHTYIENLLDAIELAIDNSKAYGEIFDITDGDHSIDFGKYFKELSTLIGITKPLKNMSKKRALKLGFLMVLFHKIIRIKPIISPFAVEILTNKEHVSIQNAKKLLLYNPQISYSEAMKEIKNWIKKEYINV